MMGDLGAQLPIDRHRVYASGFSNGAGFTARLAVERSTVLAAAAFSAGALPAAQAPAAPDPDVPDPRNAGRPCPGADRAAAADPATARPAGAAGRAGDQVDDRAHLATLGLDTGDFGVISDARSTSLRWPATGTGPDGALMRFAMLDGLQHRYPNGHNNPAGFEAAPEFWDFFRTHRLPDAAQITARARAGIGHFTPPIGTDKGS